MDAPTGLFQVGERFGAAETDCVVGEEVGDPEPEPSEAVVLHGASVGVDVDPPIATPTRAEARDLAAAATFITQLVGAELSRRRSISVAS